MYISKSNLLAGRSPNVTTGASTDLPSNMTNNDFSASYTASGNTIIATFGSVSNCNYVALSGINLAGATVSLRDGSSVIDDVALTRNHVLMFTFETRAINNITIVITAVSPVTINHVAAGQSFQVPNGGESGAYKRAWLGRNIESRVVSNDNAAPVANLLKRSAGSNTLPLPNMLTAFSRGEWQEFLDFAALGNPFYINEIDGAPRTSHVGFQPRLDAPSVNASTRALDNIQLRYNYYNGL